MKESIRYEKETEMKCLLGLADGRNEPIKDLENAQRIVLVDKDTVE